MLHLSVMGMAFKGDTSSLINGVKEIHTAWIFFIHEKNMQDFDLCPLLCCRIVEAGYNLGPDGLFYALERVSIFNKT